MKASKEAVWSAVYASIYTHWVGDLADNLSSVPEDIADTLRAEARKLAADEADRVIVSEFPEPPLESPEDVKVARYRGSPELAIVTDNAESAIIVRRADAEKLAMLLLRFAKEDKL
jgi:hypothetical protein